MAGQVVRYDWTVTPFAATAGYPKTLAEGSATTDADGVATIPFPTSEPSGTYVLHTYINQDGTPGQQSGDLGGTDLTVKAGQADIVWADGSVAQAPSNSTKTFKGSLELEDGTALAGRNIAVNWARALGGDAVVAAQSAQPAGTTRTGDTSATTATGADGSFGVALTDPPATAPADPGQREGRRAHCVDHEHAEDRQRGRQQQPDGRLPEVHRSGLADDITVGVADLIDASDPGSPGRPGHHRQERRR